MPVDTNKNIFSLTGKTALVTGASRGLGQAIAVGLAQAGADVICSSSREGGVDQTAALIRETGQKAYTIAADLSKPEAVRNLVEQAYKLVPNVDVLVNNGGTIARHPAVDFPLDEWNKVIDLNLNAVFYCCKAVVPFMIKNNYGRIVNIASIAGKEGNPNASAYSSSKAGVIGLTKSLGKELAQKNIAVNCVTPAAAKTRIFDQMTEEHINYMLSKIPRNKFAKVEELASLVAWLSSEENSFSTAAVFDLSGGRATY